MYDLKACMRVRFVPHPYRKEHLLKFQRLHQGHRMVDEYFQEFETSLIKMNLHVNDESKIKWFVSGLRREIKDLVKLHEYTSLKKVFHLVIVPSRIQALTKSRSKSTSGLKVNIRRRPGKETPSASVATRKHRQGQASPR